MYGYGAGFGAGHCCPVAPVGNVGFGACAGVGIIAIAILILIALGVIF